MLDYFKLEIIEYDIDNDMYVWYVYFLKWSGKN